VKWSGTVKQEKTQVVPCLGGDMFLSINYKGDIFPCEILTESVNIRDIDYDFNQLLVHPQWRDSVKRIKNKECHCTHFCWLSYSVDAYEQSKNKIALIKTQVKSFATSQF